MAHFEQDSTYNDMDGNLRQFKFRDYSNAGKNRQKAIPNEEAAAQASKEYNDGLRESVNEFCEEVPAVFAREVDEVVVVRDEHIEWDKEAMFIALKSYSDSWMGRHVSSVWSRVLDTTYKSIKEYINCKDPDCRDKVQRWKDHYKKTQTL